jgi:signal transduction histidine kinase
MYWKGGTESGALTGLVAGFFAWAYMLMLPSLAKSGWVDAGFLEHGPWGWALFRPEAFLGLTGLDNLTHALFWSLLVNISLFVGVSMLREPNAREASQALLFVDAFKPNSALGPVFWRGTARVDDLLELARRFLGAERAQAVFTAYALHHGAADSRLQADARLVQQVETVLAGAIGSASARAMVASVVQEDALHIEDVMQILEETSQIRAHSVALEEKSRSLELATAELRQANEQLKSLDALKDDFMSSVTHELRTPLTSIRALAEVMHDDPKIDLAQRKQFIAIIVEETERLSRLVNQVLDMAKIESGHADWCNAPVNLCELIRHAVQATAELFKAHHTTVVLDMPDQVPSLMADSDRLTQVLINLLSNAVKFTPAQGGQVSVALHADSGGVTVRVSDNGCGVRPEQRNLVFEKFRQGGDGRQRPQGTGLGLPISRQIVEHFGGRIWVEDAQGGGACFGFQLPWSFTQPQALPAEPPDNQGDVS